MHICAELSQSAHLALSQPRANVGLGEGNQGADLCRAFPRVSHQNSAVTYLLLGRT